MMSLFFRNLFFTVLQPGMVAGFIPYLLAPEAWRRFVTTPWAWHGYAGVLLFIPGFVVMVLCIIRFGTEGKGTLSPADPTRALVASGLYRYSRNPMYLGVMGMLIGEAVMLWSATLALYATAIFVAFNVFIVLHEEPRLQRDFGDAYRQYRAKVRRWL